MGEEMKEEIDKVLEWKTSPPAPVPGFYRITPKLSVDLSAHDSALDEDYQYIHTPFTEFFPIDVLQELQELTRTSEASWLRINEHIDGQYYRKQSERRDIIKRDEVNEFIDDVFDYQTYLKESFDSVQEPLPGVEVLEEYPLFPQENSIMSYVLAYDAEECNETFEEVEGGSTLVGICKDSVNEFKYVKQAGNNGIFIHIKDGKAYYAPISYIYKFEERKYKL